jgi:hypothetical protein
MIYLYLIAAIFIGFAIGYVVRWKGVSFLINWRSLIFRKTNCYSIGILTAESLKDLPLKTGSAKPVLNCGDVTDVRASAIADPFLFRHKDQWFLFIEVIERRTRCGRIGYAVSNNGFNFTYKSIILKETFHLSYPYILEHDGEIYMIPESAQDRSVRLYRATQFPTNWRFEKVLLKGHRFTDASVFLYNGIWWMFVSRNVSEDLLLYYANSLIGPWFPHPCSPIVYGMPEKARCAGRPVLLNGRLIRFAQNCENEYGREVRAFLIKTLDKENYLEEELDESPVLVPSGCGWNADGMHHMDLHILKDGSLLAAVDGRSQVNELRFLG